MLCDVILPSLFEINFALLHLLHFAITILSAIYKTGQPSLLLPRFVVLSAVLSI